MDLFSEENKSKKQSKKDRVLALLDEGDKKIPNNPGEHDSEEHSNKFQKLFENSQNRRDIKAGDIIKGKIISIKKDFVIVDVNFKSEGIISKSEFRLLKDKDILKIGQEVEVYVDRMENENGMMVLSKDKADISRAWKDIIDAAENNKIIQGTVVAQVKGGLSVDIGVRAFLPGSQLDIRSVRNMKSYIGQTYDFKVIKANQKRGNIVLSRRVLLEQEKEVSGNLATEGLSEGAIIKGVVKNITEYGVFVDLGSMDGLLHITDMSWFRLKHPSDMLTVGQEIQVKVLKFNSEKNRISLGLKQLNEEEWNKVSQQYPLGSVTKGKVVNLVDYGAFVLLEKGLEGLVHVNEISWICKVKNSSSILKIGQEVKVKVIDIQNESHKLSLSIKQAQENPWHAIKSKYSVGQEVEVPITGLDDFGVFVKLEGDIDVLVRSSDLSWTETIKPSEKYKVGDKVKVKVLEDSEGEKLIFSVKHLEENPWDSIEENYPIGSRHETEVVRVVNFGVFVKLREGVEGLIHVSELSQKRIENPKEHFKVGDKVTAEILNIDSDSKKIGLSIRIVELGKSGSEVVKSVRKAQEKKEERKSGNSGGFIENLFSRTLKASLNKDEDSKNEKED